MFQFLPSCGFVIFNICLLKSLCCFTANRRKRKERGKSHRLAFMGLLYKMKGWRLKTQIRCQLGTYVGGFGLCPPGCTHAWNQWLINDAVAPRAAIYKSGKPRCRITIYQGFSWHFHTQWLLQVGNSRLLVPEYQQAENSITNVDCREELTGGAVGSLHPSVTRQLWVDNSRNSGP